MLTKSKKVSGFDHADLARWQALPHEEKLAEFTELVESPYWYFLPEELRGRIRKMIFH